MRLINAVSLLWSITAVAAFKNTAPFLLFSSEAPPSPLRDIFTSPQQTIQSSKSVLSVSHDFIRNSDPDIVVLLRSGDAAMASIKSALQDDRVRASLSVPDVVGLSSKNIASMVDILRQRREVVSAAGNGAMVLLSKDSARVDTTARMRNLGLGSWLSADGYTVAAPELGELSSSEAKYIIIFIGAPASQDEPEHEQTRLAMELENEFAEMGHVDLKRDLGARESTGEHHDQDHIDDRPLFEKYQYFTPGIFMGLMTAIIMIAIGSVGLNAVSSLQVSYGAFDKENGPSAQKKQ